MQEIKKAVNKVNVIIDILQATTELYNNYEGVCALDILTLNTIVVIELRNRVNDIIALINQK